MSASPQHTAHARPAVSARMPSFDILVKNYPNKRSGGDVKRMIGGKVDDTRQSPDNQWLGGEEGDTCTIRMSRALNYSGLHIPAHFPGLRTTVGGDGLCYSFAVQEMRKFLTATFGVPDVDVRGKPVSRERFNGLRGIILFDIVFGMNPDGQTRAMGHVDLWDSQTFYDEIFKVSRPERDFFKLADRVSLWVAHGSAFLPKGI